MSDGEQPHETGDSGRPPPVCGECGYRLFGLPPEGCCPECGNNYDRDQIVIPGRGSGAMESTRHAPLDWFQLVLLFACVGFAQVAYWRFSTRQWTEGIIYGSFGVMTLGIGLFNRGRLHSSGEAPCHVRLFPDGFGQRNGFGKCKLHPWSTVGQLTLEPAGHGKYRLHITSSTLLLLPVSIEFECTTRQAKWLGQVIARYRHRN
jgi:hypothetical protein